MTSDTTSDSPAEPQEDEQQSSDGRKILAIVLLLIALLLPLAWFWLRTSAIPNVMGMTEPQARRVIAASGFRLGAKGEITAENVEPGHVAHQSPAPGKRMFRGSRIDIDLAAGLVPPEPVGRTDEGLDLAVSDEQDEETEPSVPVLSPPKTVPPVHNMKKSQAISVLQAQGYRVRVRKGPSTTNVKKGRVYFQDPAPDTVSGAGTTVDLWISTGPPKTGHYSSPKPRTDY